MSEAPTSKSMESLLLQTGRLFSISPIVRAGARQYQGPVGLLLPLEGGSKTLGTKVVQQTEAVEQTLLSEDSKVKESAGLLHSLSLPRPPSQTLAKEALRPSESPFSEPENRRFPQHPLYQAPSMSQSNSVAPELAAPMPLVSANSGDPTPADNNSVADGQPATADADIATPGEDIATPKKATSKKRKNRKRKKAAPKEAASTDTAATEATSKYGIPKDGTLKADIPKNENTQGLSQAGNNITRTTDKGAIDVIKKQLVHFRANAIAQFLGRIKFVPWVNDDIKNILQDTPVARKVRMVIAHTDYKAVGPSMRMLHDTTTEVRTKTPYTFQQTREHLIDALFKAFTWEDEAKGKHLAKQLVYELFKWDGR